MVEKMVRGVHKGGSELCEAICIVSQSESDSCPVQKILIIQFDKRVTVSTESDLQDRSNNFLAIAST